MNRLSPLIVRRVGPHAPGAVTLPMPVQWTESFPPAWIEDAKLFAFGWISGLVVFLTLLG